MSFRRNTYYGFAVIVALFVSVTTIAVADSIKHRSSPVVVTAPVVSAPPLFQDPTLVADAQELGINYSGLDMSFATSLTATDVISDQSNTIGTFEAPNIITIKSGQTKADELNTLAYEYLHYEWINLSSTEKEQLAADYQQFYDTNTTFQQLTANYTGTADIIADERNSTACTEIDPSALTSAFNTYCDQVIPNRETVLF